MDTQCAQCKSELPHDGKQRKRNRPRNCRKCNIDAAVKRRKDDPVRLLAHRWNNSCRRLYTDPHPSLWSPATVESVMVRCEHKSVISGEANAELLCVFPFFKETTTPPQPKQLVIVTSREAQSIAKAKTQKERGARFPPHIQEQMEMAPDRTDE